MIYLLLLFPRSAPFVCTCTIFQGRNGGLIFPSYFHRHITGRKKEKVASGGYFCTKGEKDEARRGMGGKEENPEVEPLLSLIHIKEKI